jgi:carbamoyltransferase
MAYNILGIHPGHNSSVALLSDGELVYYLEEERLSRHKRDNNPMRAIIEVCNYYSVDELVIGGTNFELECPNITWINENIFTNLVRKYFPKVKTTYSYHHHHLLHFTTQDLIKQPF